MRYAMLSFHLYSRAISPLEIGGARIWRELGDAEIDRRVKSLQDDLGRAIKQQRSSLHARGQECAKGAASADAAPQPRPGGLAAVLPHSSWQRAAGNGLR